MTEPSASKGDRWVDRLKKVLAPLGERDDPPERGGAVPPLARYEFREPLGEGATAVVYRGWDRDLQRPVAIKVLKEFVGMSEVARQRFRREAQAAANVA